MKIRGKIGVITGAGSGIGRAVAIELAKRNVKALALVDASDAVEDVAATIDELSEGCVQAIACVGNVTDADFRCRVFDDLAAGPGIPAICVPAAGITRDGLTVKIDKESGEVKMYPLETFREVMDVDLIAPIYWGMEMVSRIAQDRRARGLKRWEPEERIQGTVIFIGSISSRGNKGQIAYSAAKAGLEGGAATLTTEAIYHGVRCGVIHPGFTDTPMVRKLGDEFINKHILPYTQLRRLIRPEEIADAIRFMISNSAVSGELWADAGWHPTA